MHGPTSPLVSVIVPVFNKQDFLAACLDSICSQNLTDIEILCIDDASSDGSRDRLAEFARRDPRIRIHRNTANLGPGPSRNLGIENARGAYVQFTDADDLLPPGALETLHRLAVESGCAAVRGSVEIFPDGPAKDWLEAHSRGPNAPSRRRFRFGGEPATAVPWFHMSYLFWRGLLVERAIRYPDLRDGEDPVFLARVLTEAGLISATSQVCYRYRTDRPYERSTMRHRLDFLKHIAIVKETYLRHAPRAWEETCSAFYRGIVKELLDEPDVTAAERESAEPLLRLAWSPEELAACGIVENGCDAGRDSAAAPAGP